MLMTEIISSAATDLDLYVGLDENGNDQADESEERCASTSPDELEECLIKLPDAGRWWVMVQSWQSSVAGASDDADLEMTVLTASDGYSFSASGPGAFPGGELELDFHWDEPAMLQGERRVAAVGLSSSPDEPEDLGVVPVYVTRTADNTPRATALFDGETRAVVVPGNTVHDLLFVDVPPSASGLEIQVAGQGGIDGALYRLDHEDIAGHAPATPPAPTTDALVAGSDSEAGFSLNHSAEAGSTLPSGRYYIVLENTRAQERRVDVSVSILESDAARLPRFGLWSPRDRSIYQGFEWAAGGAGLVVWYSYDEDGVPVFYNAVGSIESGRST